MTPRMVWPHVERVVSPRRRICPSTAVTSRACTWCNWTCWRVVRWIHPPAYSSAIRARPRAKEQVGAAGHFVLADVGDDEFLTAQFVSAFHAGREDRMTLGRVAADNQDQAGFRDIGNRSCVSAVYVFVNRADRRHR